MPIILKRAANSLEENHRSLLRIAKDISIENRLHEAIAQWHAMPNHFDLMWAVFNDRNVGFVLMQGSEIKGLVVHSATRRRGIGRRMIALLKQEYPELTVEMDATNQVLSQLISEQK